MTTYVLQFLGPKFIKYRNYIVPSIVVVGTFLEKFLYRYRRYVKSIECPPLFNITTTAPETITRYRSINCRYNSSNSYVIQR